MMTWRSVFGGGVLLEELYHFSAPFYIRVIRDKDDPDAEPQIVIGNSNALGWDKGGYGDLNNGRFPTQGDVALFDGLMAITRRDSGADGINPEVFLREYKDSTGPIRTRWNISTAGFPGGADDVAVFPSRRGAVAEDMLGSQVLFHRSDGETFARTKAPMSEPQIIEFPITQNEAAADLMRMASFAPATYQRAIATNERCYAAAVAGPDPLDREMITVFRGRSEENDEGADDEPEDVRPTGTPLPSASDEGVDVTVTENIAIGHLGYDIAVFQQCAVTRTENPNPEKDYVRPNVDDPKYYNQWANWGAVPGLRWLASTFVYQVTGAGDVVNRTLVGKVENEWKVREGTPDTIVDRDGNTITVEEIYDPVLKEGSGGVLSGTFVDLDGNTVRDIIPWDFAGDLRVERLAGSPVEILPGLWFAPSRQSAGSTGQRWLVSANGGATWNFIRPEWTNGGLFRAGSTAVRMDLRVGKSRADFAIQNERPLDEAIE